MATDYWLTGYAANLGVSVEKLNYRVIDGVPWWSPEEFIARRKLSPKVADRLRRLNMLVQEGEYPRGWHSSQRYQGSSWERDVLTRGQVIRKHGREMLRRLVKIPGNGKRGMYARRDIENLADG